MIKLVRTAALAAAAALAACAPAKLTVLPSPVWDPATGGELSADQKKVVAILQEALKEKSPATVVEADASATLAARFLVNRLTEAPGVLPSEGRDLLHEAGIADLGARFLAQGMGYNDGVPNAEKLAPLLDSLGAYGAKLAVGVAELPAPMQNKRFWAVVAVPRVVALQGLPRRWEPGTKAQVAGRLLEPVTEPFLHLLKPDGVVDTFPLTVGADGAFSQEVSLPEATGQYVLEIGGRFKGVHRPLVAAPIGVGVAPMPWPPRAADVEAATDVDLKAALGKILADIRTRPLGERQDLTEAAQACAAALVAGQECATPTGILVGGFDLPSTAIERSVSEFVAMPCSRGLWQSEATGLAVAATKGGSFVVVVAFPAPAPKAEPAAAPAAAPAPEPAPAPAPEAAPAPAPAEAPAPAPAP